MPNKLNVTLTGTSNSYLVDRLPLRGEIELCELSTVGTLTTAVFRILDAEGFFGPPVHIADPVFIYDCAVANAILRSLGRYVAFMDDGGTITYRPGGNTRVPSVNDMVQHRGKFRRVLSVERHPSPKQAHVNTDHAVTDLPWVDGCRQCVDLRESLISEGPMAMILSGIGSHFEKAHQIEIVGA